MTFHFHARAVSAPTPAREPVTRDRGFRWLWLLALVLVLVLALVLFVGIARAGGPARTAGTSYFNPAAKGQPLTWKDGIVAYYTDRGHLSPQLPGPDADALLAEVFARWSSVPTAALIATSAGQLNEDVNGSNVTGYPDGTYTIPADIQPGATDKPLAVVYDMDGKVTDALLGQGAGGASSCFTNAVFGGVDAYSTDAHIAHALIVLNGVCAPTLASIPDFRYRLVRVVGRVLGLDWSQLNDNVLTRQPAPTADDYAGYPLMHFYDQSGCVPISLCLPDADSLKLDDRAAISRTYPVTSANLSSFVGKKILATTTARIHGSVYFADSAGNAVQAMPGVNVVARRIEAGQPSRREAASSVSGFAFAASPGNIVNGFTDALGQRYDRYGSDDLAVAGFYDLAGLEIPAGSSSAQFQLTVEPLDNYSSGVGPYAPWPVKSSGTFEPVVVTVARGGDVEQNIVMRESARAQNQIGSVSTYEAPSSLPAGGEWIGWLNNSAKAHFFKLNAMANRTLSIELSALDEAGNAVVNKAMPVAGMWALSDASGAPAPAQSPSAFNTATTGVTRLDAQIHEASDYRIAIADQRGDARPDFQYRARVLYAHTASPSRMGLACAKPLRVRGIGFRQGMTATVGDAPATVLSMSANQLDVMTPVLAQDGPASVLISDATGASTSMTDVVTFGADSTDNLELLTTSNPITPVGTETVSPMRVRVRSSANEPVEGATIVWDGGAGTVLSACGGARTCSALTDESGEAWTRVTVTSAVESTLSATLAPASYSPAKAVQTTVKGSSSAADLGVSPPYQWIAAGATLDMMLTARLLNMGNPVGGKTIKFQFMTGTGTLTPASTSTDANGHASSTLHLDHVTGDVEVSACVAPSNAPCKSFVIHSVAAANLRLQPVSGNGQMGIAGQSLHPLVLRVTDASTPPNPVRGATVRFVCTWMRPLRENGETGRGESTSGNHPMPVVLGMTETTIASDVEGLARLTPSPGTYSGSLEADITATTGANAREELKVEMIWPGAAARNGLVPQAAEKRRGEGQRFHER